MTKIASQLVDWTIALGLLVELNYLVVVQKVRRCWMLVEPSWMGYEHLESLVIDPERVTRLTC